MARPQKVGIDYFPHDTSSGKTMFTLEAEYQNDGYAFWFKLLELLGLQSGLYYDCRNPADWRFLVAKTRVSQETATGILDLLSELQAIDTELWEKHKIIWVQNYVNRVSDVYRKRGHQIPKKPVFETETPENEGFCDRNEGKEGVSGAESTQRKLNKIKNPPLSPQGDGEMQGESLTVETAQGAGKPASHSTTLAERFEIFYKAYPKKRKRGDAEKAWNALKPNPELLEQMLASLAIATKSEDWQKQKGQYIPYPASWLRAKGWLDEYQVGQGQQDEAVELSEEEELKRLYG